MRRSRSCSNAAAFRYIVHPRNPRQILSHFLTVFFVAAVKKKKAFVSQNIKVSWTAHGCYAGPLWCAAWLHDRLPESSPQLAEHLESWRGSPEQSGCGAGGQSDERRELCSAADPRDESRPRLPAPPSAPNRPAGGSASGGSRSGVAEAREAARARARAAAGGGRRNLRGGKPEQPSRSERSRSWSRSPAS